ncbi:plasmid replication protein RepC [Acuticoccus sediminis]|uniref:plasmid replication protein RepC n=1 Tax=Acuticoccus sediminis TaxID=2184697 RepID=UPI001CFD3FA9|nr:plasmid replication protein RepC [Acuticoccus sediminis]
MQLASSGGRRLRHAALVAGQHALDSGRIVTRKELSAAYRLAQEALGLRPTLRLVLSELVANWGEQPWERLLVWPSNEHLILRTGLSERALRVAFRALTDLGLIVPKDSPNGKRYAVRDAAGTTVDAFGFDLTPLYAQRESWAGRVAELKAERQRIKRAFDEITIARRATEEAIDALHETYPQMWRPEMEQEYDALLARTPRRGTAMPPVGLLDAWSTLRCTVERSFFHAGNGGTTCRHNKDNNDSSSETCYSGFRKNEGGEAVPDGGSSASAGSSGSQDEPPEHEVQEHEVRETMTAAGRTEPGGRVRPSPGAAAQAEPVGGLAADLVPAAIREACPATMTYGRPARTPAEVVALGAFLRPMLGANETVWTEAVASIGPLRAAVAVIYVTQLYEDDLNRGGDSRIRNPGGYLRAFVRMVASGKIDLAADLLAMRRRRMGT